MRRIYKTFPLSFTDSSKVQANETLAEVRKTAPQLSETLAKVTKAPVSAGPLEMPQEEETVVCCFFRMPKFKFSFKVKFSFYTRCYCIFRHCAY